LKLQQFKNIDITAPYCQIEDPILHLWKDEARLVYPKRISDGEVSAMLRFFVFSFFPRVLVTALPKLTECPENVIFPREAGRQIDFKIRKQDRIICLLLTIYLTMSKHT
jgi:hypothetical protein